ncbi:MAG: tRNA (cytidine(34)-2'-O)-methyltransferase [Alphaproteobacteria bacterium]
MRIALFQPDIPQNTGAILRLGACLGVAVDIVEPCGFVLDDRRLRRVAMDYGARAVMQRHASWTAFLEAAERSAQRLVLLTTRATRAHIGFAFHPDDVLVLGRESAGAPPEVHAACAAAIRVPIHGRSLNLVVAAAIVLGEALRQTGGYPPDDPEAER